MSLYVSSLTLEICGWRIQSWEMTVELGEARSHQRKPHTQHVSGYSESSMQLLLRLRRPKYSIRLLSTSKPSIGTKGIKISNSPHALSVQYSRRLPVSHRLHS